MILFLHTKLFGGITMIKRKSLATCIILSFVTCGIYTIYWFYSMTKDVVSMNSREYTTEPTTAVLLNLVTCGIYGMYWNYKMGKALDEIKASRGIRPADQSIVYLILGVFGLGMVSWALIQNEINELANA